MGSDAVTFLAIPPRKAVQLISENAYYSVIVEGGPHTWEIYWDKGNDRLLSSSKKLRATLERHKFTEQVVQTNSTRVESGTVGTKMTWDSGNSWVKEPVEDYEIR